MPDTPSDALTREERRLALGYGGATVWLTGLPAAGKTTLSIALERAIVARGRQAYRLDGDEIRRELCRDLGFDRDSRAENVRRVAHVSALLAEAGVLTVVALVSPYAIDRQRARELHDQRDIPFFEIFLDTPIEICERRDPKGLYARARQGELTDLTGAGSPYERPESPDLRLEPESPDTSAGRICKALLAAGVL